jgi:hypothetical protein
MKRSFDVFGQIYEHLFKRYSHFLPDSRLNVRQKLFIADSSTITLFQEILKSTKQSKREKEGRH